MNRDAPPFYVPVGSEMQVFRAAFRQDLSVMLKGPNGCGKTRFVEAMAQDLGRPLITVACHDDLTTADFVGKLPRRGADPARSTVLLYMGRPGGCDLLSGRDRRGPTRHDCRPPPAGRLSPSAPHGAARRDTGRRDRLLPCRVVQPGLPERPEGSEGLDPSAHGGHRADFPPADMEEKILVHEAGIDEELATSLVRLGWAIRRLETSGCAKSHRRGCSSQRLGSSLPA